MSSREFEFHTKDRRNPYIDEVIDYNVSEDKGYIYFNGYYYVLNEEFPIRMFFTSTLYEDEPTEVVEIDGNTRKRYKVLETVYYEVEIYDREKLKDTSEFGEMEDEDGSRMRVCFFPTHEQKIYFKVIKVFDSFDDFLRRTREYFTEEPEKA
jgi:hypothetical protein